MLKTEIRLIAYKMPTENASEHFESPNDGWVTLIMVTIRDGNRINKTEMHLKNEPEFCCGNRTEWHLNRWLFWLLDSGSPMIKHTKYIHAQIQQRVYTTTHTLTDQPTNEPTNQPTDQTNIHTLGTHKTESTQHFKRTISKINGVKRMDKSTNHTTIHQIKRWVFLDK